MLGVSPKDLRYSTKRSQGPMRAGSSISAPTSPLRKLRLGEIQALGPRIGAQESQTQNPSTRHQALYL